MAPAPAERDEMLCISSRIEGARSVHDAVAGTYQFPTAIEPCTLDVATDVGAALDWVRRSKDAIESRLASTGALVFRGFPLDTAEDFAAFIDALGYPNFAYAGAGGNAVRKNVVGDRVFTANESPPEKVIPFHNELAQCPVFPHRVLFFCDVPAAEGGATPLLDCHRVYVKLRDAAPAFMDELEAKGVRYTRVTTVDDRPSSAVGRGWAGTFGVSDAAALEAKLEGTGQTVEWLTDVDLRRDLDVPEAELDALLSRQPLRHYSAPLSAVRDLDDQQRRRRPEENKRYFFNQIMAAHLGWRDELNLPGRSVVFGDGGAISEEAMDVMARIFEEEAVAVPWRHGDVMLLDNLQVMHSRQSFVNGAVPRRVLASLAGNPTAPRGRVALDPPSSAPSIASAGTTARGGGRARGSRTKTWRRVLVPIPKSAAAAAVIHARGFATF